MGRMTIKKEDIKKDIIINFDNNSVYGNFNDKPIISLLDGELEINIENFKMFKEGVLENFTFKNEFIDNFKIKLGGK